MGKPCPIGEGVKKEVRANISRAIAGEKVEPVEKGRWAQSGERRAEKTGGIHARSGLVKKHGWPLPPDVEKAVKARFGKTVSPDQGTRIALSQHVPKLVRKAEAAQRISWEQSPTSKALTKARRAERVARRKGGTTFRAVEQLEYIKHFLEEGKLDKLTPEVHYIRKGQKGYQPDRVKRLKSSKESWERIKKQMSDAKKAGKPVTYRVEGGTGKTHGNPVVRRAARMYAKKHRLDYEEKSLEHPRSDPADPQSDISKHVKKIRGEKEGEADRQAFLRGGNPPDTFPRDYGLPATPRSKSTDRFNRGRRLGMRKGLQTDVKKGRETVGTVGRDHIENPDYLKKGKSGKYVGEQVK